MSGTIGDILRQLGVDTEKGLTKTASSYETKPVGVVEEIDGLIDEMFSFRKKAQQTVPVHAQQAGEMHPQQQVQMAEPQMTPEEEQYAIQQAQAAAPTAVEEMKSVIKQNILQAGMSVVEDSLNELSEEQQTKISSAAAYFDDNPVKSLLFEILSRQTVSGTPRIVNDRNFASTSSESDEEYMYPEGEDVNIFE